ncbi:MAG TPA: aminotransferase class III-fold pyridoxal phosphate-dependent enzyme [Planctomycetota bacterium]|nr:aminotransferase class III-fold pyridoxal phosphate-dependent enzyme [Planctomycetota bacterium]
MSGEQPPTIDADVTARMLCEARELLSYGNLDSILQRPWAPVDDAPFPHFVASAHGCRMVDTLGREYVDWVGGGGTNLLGHGHPLVREAILAQLERGSSLSMMNPLELELARELCDIVPCAERVAFGKNGSDALTAALRVARASTGREIVLHYGMHGFHDWFVAGNANVRGAPHGLAERLHPFPYNDLAALEALFARHRGAVAAVVMEPVREDLPKPGYMLALADLVRREGALLIFDEVVTALRLGLGGGQAYVGVEPDLACLGKSLANGLPLSALVGTRKAMEIVPAIGFGMTFRGEALALAAAKAVLRIAREQRVAEHLAEIGEELRARWNSYAARLGLRSRLAGPPARLTCTFEPQGGRTPGELQALCVQELLKRGIFSNGNFLPSLSHDIGAVERTAEAFEGALDAVARLAGTRLPRAGEPATPPMAAIATGFVERVETSAGRVALSGWLLLADGAADAIEALLADGTRIEARRTERPDVAASRGGEPAAQNCGWILEAPVRPPCELQLRLSRGDRKVWTLRVVIERGSISAPRWAGDGIVYV